MIDQTGRELGLCRHDEAVGVGGDPILPPDWLKVECPVCGMRGDVLLRERVEEVRADQ